MGFKNPSAIHAALPLRNRQHKLPVQRSTITGSFSSDSDRIGSLDGRVLPPSKNVQNSLKWTTVNKIRDVSIMRKLKFAMRPSARRHNVFKSSHGAGMPLLASIFRDGKDPSSSITGLPYKTKITAPFKLMILPTEETGIASVDTADAELDWNLKQGNYIKHDDKKSAHSNDKDDNSSPHGQPRVTGQEGPMRHADTSAMPMSVYPGVKPSSGIRWKAAYDPVTLDDSKKGTRPKNKKKKYHPKDEEPEDLSSSAATVAGIVAGILMLLFIFTGVPHLW